MRTVLVVCFIFGVVSSLPIRTEEDPDLPQISEADNNVEGDPDFPILSELPLPEIPEDEIEDIGPDLPVPLLSLPTRSEEDQDLTISPEVPESLPAIPEAGILENDPDFPIWPELPTPETLEGDIEGFKPDLTVHPEMPILPHGYLKGDLDLRVADILQQPELHIESEQIVIEPLIEYGIDEGNNVTMRNQIRPGMLVSRYVIEITPNIGAGTFNGRLTTTVIISDASTLEDPAVFYVEDLNINSVTFSITGSSAINQADFNVDDGLLEIETGFQMSLYTFFIEYTGFMSNLGSGLWSGGFESVDYMAMNLHATNARRVFPCMDELTEPSIISFVFNDMPYNFIFSNSGLEDNTQSTFKALQGPGLLWGMVAHNFNNINNPTAGVQLYARPGVINQENQASVAINFYYNNLELWTQKPYNEIVLDQDGRMLIMALPDVHKDWYALSTVCIWEPYLLMERVNSAKQRKEALTEIAEAISRQWYGYVIYPENWRFQWVVQGLASYTGFELNKEFQNTQLLDVTLIDFNTIFVTDVIQEALYRDGYSVANPLEPAEDLFDEDAIRDHIWGLGVLKYKAPAIMSMLKLILGNENQDFVQSAGQILLNSRALETVNSRFFIDAINAEWLTNGNNMVDDIAEFLEPWIQSNGYPCIHVSQRQGGVTLTQEKFGFSASSQASYLIPVTWTTSVAPNFDTNNIRPTDMMDATMTINMALGEEDYVLFNIQGQGYYRVNYVAALWERIIEALSDPDRREQIHPLNRATLVDDALNLARAGMLDYDTAFQVVLTMEHEIHYAPWKAFVRNMEFLRKRLMSLLDEFEDELDPDIYLRMVRRTVGRVENEIGFYPDISVTEDSDISLTRGLVMEHACKAGYRPCIAAAVDWFWDPDNRDVVNPNIPHEIRPAVYCTMVREGGNDIINALYARLEIEPTMYERVVILESLACSQDMGFIMSYLMETLAFNGPYSTEERNRIFKAVASSSTDNTFTAIMFISQRTAEIRNTYGGAEKLEDIIWHLAEQISGDFLAMEFTNWANSIISDLFDSETAAQRGRELINENLVWERAHLDFIYEWIDENDAPTLVVSMALILGSFLLTIFNH